MENEIITFNPSLKTEILKYFGYGINKEDEIIELDNTESKALTPEGEILTLSEFAGIRGGSLLFIKSDIVSLIKLADKLI